LRKKLTVEKNKKKNAKNHSHRRPSIALRFEMLQFEANEERRGKKLTGSPTDVNYFRAKKSIKQSNPVGKKGKSQAEKGRKISETLKISAP
jgi:hypothetical protein